MARQLMMVPWALLLVVACDCKKEPPAAEAESKAEQAESRPAATDNTEPAAEKNAAPPAATDNTEPAAGKPAGEAPPKEMPITADSPLLQPDKATARAPGKYTARLETAKGDILIDVQREWAPLGADRFYNLVKAGYYDGVAFFRVIEGFMAQVGIHGDPRVNAVWRERRIADDPVKQSNARGMVSFATSGPDSRTTQFFINFGDNSRLDGMGFSPFGKVRDMKPVDSLYGGYGEGAPRGRGPLQARLQSEGNSYLRAEFPELDYIRRATIEK